MWPCCRLWCLVRDHLMVQCFLCELQGGKAASPGLQFLPLNPFSIVILKLFGLGPVCLLPVYKGKRESFALSLTLCTMD